MCACVQASQVTAAQYCDFLNQNAASDPDYFYDQHMASDPATACIVRKGRPGRWQYQVIAGREDFPICYVNGFDSICYNAMSVMTEDEKNFDGFLKSNHTGCTADRGEDAETLSLASAPSKEKNHSFFSEATLTKIGLIFLGMTMMEEGVRRPALDTPGDRQASTVERNFIKKNTARPLESGKTMNISQTPKNYGSCETTPSVEELKKSVPVQKFNGVKIVVVSPEEHAICQKSGISSMSLIKDKKSAQAAPVNPFWKGTRAKVLTKTAEGIVNFLDVSQGFEIVGDVLIKAAKKASEGIVSSLDVSKETKKPQDNPLPNHRVIAGETTPLLEKK